MISVFIFPIFFASWLTYIVMIVGELCNFTGAQCTTHFFAS